MELEASVGVGRTIDLVGRREGDVVAVEVEVSGRRMAESVEKLAASRAHRMLLVAASSEVLARARDVVRNRPSEERIEVVHAWSLVGSSSASPEKGPTHS